MQLTKNFKLEEFNISGAEVPPDVVHKLTFLHAAQIEIVREEIGLPILVSKKSGYRPVWWEKQRGRSGNSQHTFKGKGAVDWTVKDFKKNGDKLLDAIVSLTTYTRIAIYDTFIHCDFKDVSPFKKIIFKNTKTGWIRLREL